MISLQKPQIHILTILIYVYRGNVSRLNIVTALRATPASVTNHYGSYGRYERYKAKREKYG